MLLALLPLLMGDFVPHVTAGDRARHGMMHSSLWNALTGAKFVSQITASR
jgi:hypothetical protein